MLFSIIALYNYDGTILNGIEPYLPDKPSKTEISTDYYPINFDILKNTILLRAGELSLIYTEPNLFKLALATWAAKNRLKWQNLYDTLYYNYDPLFSKIRQYTLDRKTHDTSDSENTTKETTSETADTNNNETTNTTGNEKLTLNTAQNTVESNGKNTGQNTNNESTLFVQAFNDINPDKWYGKERTVDKGSINGYENGNRNSTTTDSGNNDREFTENAVNNLIGKLTRNITKRIDEHLSRVDNGTLQDIITETVKGQRPYQELISLQREIVEFNLYDKIADDFVAEFCVMIY